MSLVINIIWSIILLGMVSILWYKILNKEPLLVREGIYFTLIAIGAAAHV